ncbi:sensitivity to red-light reduced protein [Lunasporangiospora selenospora]|uniref:Sensitivity to red-light reduced protein n=1 Tax=Lunasporangiospora selenospora TaxID=979761 RepID=A0A9P6KAQ7_9FUNG|nr:sensitivity to red-light reduced protein [Lunasporangiospora selenospora]
MASPASSPLVAPLSPPPSPSMSMESINGDDETRRLRVMIVDDNNLNLDILSRMLDRHFADTVDSVVKVSSGKEALALLADEIFDLILMDIDMPELSGVDTTLEIRSANSVYGVLSANKSVPIIAVTTSDAAHQRKRYLEVGMYDCVSKPIHKDPLRFAIEGALKSVPAVATG